MDQGSIDLPPAAAPQRSRAASPLQERIAAAFDIQPEHREAIVRGMLERSARGAAGYWLQLLLAMGIASLGLVLGSGAVVIGAMLISPLMGPIVELGMGLAIGSPFLALRSFARVGFSIAVVVLSAALLTLMLPFHEVTGEIAARTSPTALDLLIASFCAIAAAYTTARPGSDTTSTAAGTAIGIALVPPLCVIGYGIGTRAAHIASGAALLFTANLCAILLFAIVCFLLLGYGAVSTAELEHAELAKQRPGLIRRAARALEFVFGLRHGWLFRVMMPLALLAVVFVPLREALARVTWQVRVRTAILSMVDALPQSTVRSSVSVDHGSVVVRLVTLGLASEAERIERELHHKIRDVAGIAPKVDVIAVPDASALQEVAASVRSPSPPIEVARRDPDLALVRQELSASLAQAWPHAAGPLAAWRLRFPENSPAQVEVVHVGPELGAPAAELLSRALSRDLGAEITVRDLAVSPEPVLAEPNEGLAWLRRAERVLAWVNEAEELHACIEVPRRSADTPTPKQTPRDTPERGTEDVDAVLRALPVLPADRVHVRDGARWRAEVSTTPCAPPPAASPATADAGAPAALDGSADAGAR